MVQVADSAMKFILIDQ